MGWQKQVLCHVFEECRGGLVKEKVLLVCNHPVSVSLEGWNFLQSCLVCECECGVGELRGVIYNELE